MLKNNMYSCNYNFPMSLSENDANCIPKLDDSCSFMDFPNSSPHTHLDYEASINHLHFYDLFYQQQSSSTSAELDQSSAEKMADTKENAAVVVLKEARKRCSKKDRHSKINTMHGPRDRRMRLSLDVARKFFNLQDLLGFDKPSKTVDWLLKSSRTAITELEGGRRGMNPLLLKSNNVSSNSESCEEVVNLSGSLANLCSSITVENGLELETTLTISEKKKKKKVKKIKATIARDSRIKARERARERTSQKRRLSEQRTDHQLNLTSSCADQESVLRATHEIVTNSSFSAWEFNPSIVFNYGHNPAGILNLHCLAEFQYGSKPWEGLHSLL